MKTYCVYLPPDKLRASDESDTHFYGDEIFVEDGRSALAALFPPFWLAWHRLWWALFVYMLIYGAIILLYFTAYKEAAIFLAFLPGLYLWLEGHKLLQQRFELRGWIFQGVVHGSGEEDAALRYYNRPREITKSEIDDAPIDRVNTPTITQPVQSIGLFPLES